LPIGNTIIRLRYLVVDNQVRSRRIFCTAKPCIN